MQRSFVAAGKAAVLQVKVLSCQLSDSDTERIFVVIEGG